MAIVNSNLVELLLHTTGTAPAADAENSTFTSIGHVTSVTLDINRENITVTNKTSNSHAQRIAGMRDFTGSFEGFIDYAQATQNLAGTTDAAADTANVTELFGFMDAGTTIYIRFGIGASRFIAPVLLNNINQSAGTDEAGTYTASFEAADAISYDADVTS